MSYSKYGPKHNCEGYRDMTAYLAIRRVDAERQKNQDKPHSDRRGCQTKASARSSR